MTPKEKALEIYFAMLNKGKGITTDFLAKECALVAVNEILQIKLWAKSNGKPDKEFWKDVKTQIQLL
jgi:hypothetical protein